MPAERVPLSGSAGGSFASDLRVRVGGVDQKVECKSRQRAWLDLYGWLKGNFALVIKRNNDVPLVVLTLETFVALHGEKL